MFSLFGELSAFCESIFNRVNIERSQLVKLLHAVPDVSD